MDTIADPSYAAIYIDKIEKSYFYLEKKNDCLKIHWWHIRHIQKRRSKTNMMYDTIKFDFEMSIQSTVFLDTQVNLDKNRQL